MSFELLINSFRDYFISTDSDPNLYVISICGFMFVCFFLCVRFHADDQLPMTIFSILWKCPILFMSWFSFLRFFFVSFRWLKVNVNVKIDKNNNDDAAKHDNVSISVYWFLDFFPCFLKAFSISMQDHWVCWKLMTK